MSATTEKRTLAQELREWGLDLSKRVAAIAFGAPVQVPPMIENAAAALELAEKIEAMDPESWADRESRIAWETRLEREYRAKLERKDAGLRTVVSFLENSPENPMMSAACAVARAVLESA